MSYDIHSLLAHSAVATAPSPATSGTSLVLTAGEGARFPSSGSFDVLIWPTGTSPPSWTAGLATGGNFEICRATRSTDTLTLTRAQYGTTARSILVGDQVAQPLLPRDLTDIEAASASSGVIFQFGGRTPPAGALACDGVAYSRVTYANLYNAIVPSMGACTMTIASPGVVTLVAHGLLTGESVFLTTTGALPTGLAVNTLYWVTRVDADTFKLATSRANAVASTNINTTGSQSGVHTLWDCPWGLGDGSTTFNVPDLNGRTLVGAVNGTGGHADLTLGNTEGVALINRHAEHTHTVVQPTISSPTITQPTISAPAINVVQPTITKPNVTINDSGHTHVLGTATGDAGSSNRLAPAGSGAATASAVTGITASLASTPTASGGTATLANAPVATGAALASAPVATAGTVGPAETLPVDTPAWAGVRHCIWT